MLQLRKVLFFLCTCYFWNPTELTQVEYADVSFTYGRNSTQAEHKDSHKPFFSRRIFGSIPTPTCNHEFFCENAAGYPAKELLPILTAHKDLQTFFGVDNDEIETSGASRNDKYLCASRKKVIFPTALKNQDHNWKYVVNQSGRFQQGVLVELCIENQRSCQLATPPLGYKTTCKQKYSYRRLLSVSSTGEPEGDIFILPTACCCSYTYG